MTTKTDMERVGLFKELGYHTIGDPYKSTALSQFNQAASKGKQMLIGGEKQKSGTSVGYFTEFSRIFDGEGYSDPIKLKRTSRVKESKKNLGKDWIPVNGYKDACGIGTHYGTFSGAISHFEAISRDGKNKVKEEKNFYTSPSKKGVGYGYVGLTLNKYPEYQSEKYDQNKSVSKQESDDHKSKTGTKGVFRLGMHGVEYFDTNPYTGPSNKYISSSAKTRESKIFKPSSPTKVDGGMKAGCFESFPTYSSSPYRSKSLPRVINVVNNTGKTFIPTAGHKSRPVNSVLQQNILRTITPMNYRMVQSVMSY